MARPTQRSQTAPLRRSMPLAQSSRKLWSVWTTGTRSAWAAANADGEISGKVL